MALYSTDYTHSACNSVHLSAPTSIRFDPRLYEILDSRFLQPTPSFVVILFSHHLIYRSPAGRILVVAGAVEDDHVDYDYSCLEGSFLVVAGLAHHLSSFPILRISGRYIIPDICNHRHSHRQGRGLNR